MGAYADTVFLVPGLGRSLLISADIVFVKR